MTKIEQQECDSYLSSFDLLSCCSPRIWTHLYLHILSALPTSAHLSMMTFISFRLGQRFCWSLGYIQSLLQWTSWSLGFPKKCWSLTIVTLYPSITFLNPASPTSQPLERHISWAWDSYCRYHCCSSCEIIQYYFIYVYIYAVLDFTLCIT